MADGPLGRLVPSDFRHVEKYPLRAVMPEAVARVERRLRLPAWHRAHDQGREGACVGFGLSMMMSILNEAEARSEHLPPYVHKYNARWLWNEAKKVDEFPDTNPGDDNGTSVRAGCDILRELGHVRYARRVEMPASLAEGIKENRWAQSVDDVRTSIAARIPVTIGVNWYRNFDAPVKKKAEFWIGEGDLGMIRGGHALCVYGASDRRQAVALKNSWGADYPLVWLPYGVLQRLLDEQGEATLVTDRT